jgi:hypothetical protein
MAMTTYTIQPDSIEYLDAARAVINKHRLPVRRVSEWWDIGGTDNLVREEFQRLWWLDYGCLVMVPNYHYFGLWAPVEIEWPPGSDKDHALFILRWS